MKMKRLLIVAFQVIVVLASTVVISQRTSDWRLLGYWCLCAGVIIFCMVSVIVPRKFTHLPPAPGRVLAIIPAYNESQEAINGTKAEHIRYAVFFMIGEKVAADPRIVAAVVKAGYAVEVHTSTPRT